MRGPVQQGVLRSVQVVLAPTAYCLKNVVKLQRPSLLGITVYSDLMSIVKTERLELGGGGVEVTKKLYNV